MPKALGDGPSKRIPVKVSQLLYDQFQQTMRPGEDASKRIRELMQMDVAQRAVEAVELKAAAAKRKRKV